MSKSTLASIKTKQRTLIKKDFLMKLNLSTKSDSEKLIIKKCHLCGQINSGYKEPHKCTQCKKSFLPLNYFSKIHSSSSSEYENLFASSNEIHEEDVVKGLTVIW